MQRPIDLGKFTLRVNKTGDSLDEAFAHIGNPFGGEQVAYRTSRGEVIATRGLPMRYEAVLDCADPGAPAGDADADTLRFVRVMLVLQALGSEAKGTLRVGIGSVSVEGFRSDSDKDPAHISPQVMKDLPLLRLARRALASWSNSTEGEAAQLMRPGRSRPQKPREKWRDVAVTYLEAKRDHKPTSQAVIDKMRLHEKKDPATAARQWVHRAAANGVLAEVAVEMGLEHLLTEQQRTATYERKR